MCLMMNTFSRQNEYMRLVNAFILTTHFIEWRTISIHNEILYTYIKYIAISAIDIFDSYVQRIDIIFAFSSTNHPFQIIFLAELKSGLIDMTLIILTTSIIYVVWLRESSYRERGRYKLRGNLPLMVMSHPHIWWWWNQTFKGKSNFEWIVQLLRSEHPTENKSVRTSFIVKTCVILYHRQCFVSPTIVIIP